MHCHCFTPSTPSKPNPVKIEQQFLCLFLYMAIEAHLYPTNAVFPFYSQQQHGWQMNQDMSLVDPNFSCFSSHNVVQPLASYPQSLAIEREIDNYIISQNEKLRILLQEQRKQLLKTAELNALYMLRQKDEEIAEARKKNSELKEYLTGLEVQKESWRKDAEKSEAMIWYLNNTLEREEVYRMRTEYAESCCDENEVAGAEVQQIRKRTIMDCKCCNSQKSCFMFLPCRHLCSCKTCEPFLQLCPVCNVPKKSTIETLIL